jgi:hypothetical protein
MTETNPYENVKKSIYIIFIIITLYILYQTYKYLNVSYRVTQIIPYNKDLKWVDTPDCMYDDKLTDAILSDFFISSSTNTPFVSNLKYDYLDLEIIKKTLLAGARFLEFTITESDLSDHPTPVVSKRIDANSITTTFNTLKFEEVCYTLKKYGFQSFYNKEGILSENRYPLFIHLDVQSTNPNFLEDIASTIKKMWGNRLLDRKYNHIYNDLAHINICQLFGKIVIMTHQNIYQSTSFDSLINYSKLKRLHYNQLYTYNLIEESRKKGYKTPTDDEIIQNPKEIDLTNFGVPLNQIGKDIVTAPDHLTEYTKQNLVVIYPSTYDDIEMKNYDFSLAMSHGCNFIGMNYQVDDTYLDKYLQVFQEKPMILKNANLRIQRDKIKNTIPPVDIAKPSLTGLISRADLLFNELGCAILTFIQDGVFFKYNPVSNNLDLVNLPKPQPNNEFNKLGFDEIDLFILTESLSKTKDSFSFKSVKYPGKYLVNMNNIIKLLPIDKTENYKLNASFKLVSQGEEADIKYYRIVMANDHENYFRVIDDKLMVDKYNGEKTFNAETKFSFRNAKVSKYYSFKDYMGRYLRILNGGFLTANITQIDSSAKFKVYKLLNDHYGILASNNNFLEYNYVDTVSATAPELKDNATNFQIIKNGNVYQITTYFEYNRKTIFPASDGSIKLMYDGNVINHVRKPELGRAKYFNMVQSYGIDRKEKQII